MSEMTTSGFTVPAGQNFDTETFQGSMQQVLSDNIGSYVIVEFLIGTGSLNVRQGLLYSVASQFLVLYDELEYRYIVCDIFSVKFVTFLLPGYRPGQIPAEEPDTENPAAEATMARRARLSPSQAAYAHATRKPVRR